LTPTVGAYEISPGLVFTVTREGDKLTGQSTGEKRLHELLPQNETTFFIKGDPDLDIFVKDEKGQVTNVIFRSMDGREIKRRRSNDSNGAGQFLPWFLVL